jgi:GTP cyclohydrolase II
MAINDATNNSSVSVEQMACARIPTDVGEFQLCYYRNNIDDKEHLALFTGDVSGQQDALVRVHSECFTGDVLGSLRCDCGPQLQEAMRLIANEERGIIIYMRQEGRNIGLLDKLRAYNLQDDGYDTVEANLMLGHQADSRDYIIAARILQDLGVTSLRLLTNNPQKIEDLRRHGLTVSERVPLQTAANHENLDYLRTKAKRMRHMLDLDLLVAPQGNHITGRPFVTLSYAQSLDGSIAARRGEPLMLSGTESMMMTHRLRAEHDAILVGIGTVIGDDPRLTVRLVAGDSPQPVVLDSRLRFPLTASLLSGPQKPWIATVEDAPSANEKALQHVGARVVRLPATKEGKVDLRALLAYLRRQGIASLMVEGGAGVITSFLSEGLADRLVLTVAPNLVGGIPAIQMQTTNGRSILPRLQQPSFTQVGSDLVVIGNLTAHNK